MQNDAQYEAKFVCFFFFISLAQIQPRRRCRSKILQIRDLRTNKPSGLFASVKQT